MATGSVEREREERQVRHARLELNPRTSRLRAATERGRGGPRPTGDRDEGTNHQFIPPRRRPAPEESEGPRSERPCQSKVARVPISESIATTSAERPAMDELRRVVDVRLICVGLESLRFALAPLVGRGLSLLAPRREGASRPSTNGLGCDHQGKRLLAAGTASCDMGFNLITHLQR